MEDASWKEKTLKKLRELLEVEEAIISLSLFGSLTNQDVKKDIWSDIDVFLVVADEAMEKFYQSSDWLKELGDIFALHKDIDEMHANVKVIFSDFRKIDIVIAPKSNVGKELAYLQPQQVVFSKDPEITNLIQNPPKKIKSDSTSQFNYIINEFWFLSFTSVTKLMRNDLLIGLHLALELYRMNLVLGMLLRDRDLGTDVHRIGGIRNNLAEKMGIKFIGSTKEEILGLIEKSGIEFDKLASEYSPKYHERSSVFKKVIELARNEI